MADEEPLWKEYAGEANPAEPFFSEDGPLFGSEGDDCCTCCDCDNVESQTLTLTGFNDHECVITEGGCDNGFDNTAKYTFSNIISATPISTTDFTVGGGGSGSGCSINANFHFGTEGDYEDPGPLIEYWWTGGGTDCEPTTLVEVFLLVASSSVQCYYCEDDDKFYICGLVEFSTQTWETPVTVDSETGEFELGTPVWIGTDSDPAYLQYFSECVFLLDGTDEGELCTSPSLPFGFTYCEEMKKKRFSEAKVSVSTAGNCGLNLCPDASTWYTFSGPGFSIQNHPIN